MAEAELLLTIDPLGAEAIEEELCPSCWCPSLVRVTFTVAVLGDAGVPSAVHAGVVCPGCEIEVVL